MNLAKVMDEIAAKLDEISGVRVSPFPPPTISPPSGFVSYPERVEYHQTYQGGMTRVQNLPVCLVVGKATDRAARDAVTAYVAETGDQSVKYVLENGSYINLYTLVVMSADFDVVTIAAVDYLAAIFTLDVTAPGLGE